MKSKLNQFARHYQAALRSHLQAGRRASLKPARGLGGQALAAGWQTLDLAKLHERTLVTEILVNSPAGRRAALIRQAGAFFAVAITPVEEKLRGARAATAHLKKFIETLSQRTVELAASNLELSLEIVQRKAAEAALRKSERHYARLLGKSDRMQQQLRRLSRQLLSAQEDERKRISRELHDVIAQTLTGITIRLATLKKTALLNTKNLDDNIALTQQLVEKSVDIVHQFARELRPAALDDLGLLSALQSFLQEFTERTGVRAYLKVYAGVEQLAVAKRMVLFRVAQEALTNVARHAKASRVEVSIQQVPDGMDMLISDDGKSFDVRRLAHSRSGRHLGLLGMRERLEMVGGRFRVESAPGQGTTVAAWIPTGRTNHRGSGVATNVSKSNPEPTVAAGTRVPARR